MDWLDSRWRNMRYAARMLVKAPGFTIAAVATLALGIGANTAIFSLVKTVMLTPLPYAAPERLVMVWNSKGAGDRTWLSLPEVLSYRDDTTSFEAAGGYIDGDVNLTGGAEPERVPGGIVTGEFFETLGVTASIGRTIGPSDTHPGAPEVAVISDALWQRRFGGARVIGGTLRVNGGARTIVGIMPRGFRLPVEFGGRASDVWLPQAIDPANLGQWGNRSYLTVARLRPRVSAAAATAELKVVADRWVRAGLVKDQGDGGLYRSAIPLQEFVTGNVRRPLLVLLGAVAVVLLIACANVVNLLLARADRRRREVAVRAALGARRRDVMAQFLSESVLLATISGGAGLAVAQAALRVLVIMRPAGLPRLEETALDYTVLAFTAALSIAIGLLFGVVPAIRLSRTSLSGTLNETGRSAPGRVRLFVRRGLVCAQLALSVILIVAAGLLLRTLLAMNNVDLGFDARGVLTAQLQLPSTDYRDAARVNGFYRELMQRLAGLPGVDAAGAVRILPLSRTIGDWSITIEGRPAAANENPNGDFQFVTPGYFEAMKMTLVRGRWLSASDREDTMPVVVVNDTMAERYWPGVDPVGKRFQMGGPGSTRPFMTIVGIARTSRHNAILEEPRAEMYLPHVQTPESAGTIGRSMAIVVRTSGDPRASTGALRDAVRALDANLPVADIRPMEQLTADALSAPRFASLLLGAFAAVAVALAAVGTYAVISLLVAERAQEIGIRMALGAERRTIVASILREGVGMAMGGVAIGMGGAMLVSRLLESLLYGVRPLDPLTFGGVPLLLGAIAVLASLVPARRAASIDPVGALRME